MLDKKVAYKDKEPQSVLVNDIPATGSLHEEQDSSGKKVSLVTAPAQNNQSHHSSFNNNIQFVSNGNHNHDEDSPPTHFSTTRTRTSNKSNSRSKTKTKTRKGSYLIKDEDSPSSSEESDDYDDEYLDDNDDNNDIPIIPGIVLNGSDVDSAFEDKGLEDTTERRGGNKNMKKRPNYYQQRNRDTNHKESGSSVASSVSYPSGDKLRRSQMDIMDLEIEPISKLILTPEDESNPRTHWLLSPDPTQFNMEISPSRSIQNTKIFQNGDTHIFNDETEKIILETGPINPEETDGANMDKFTESNNKAKYQNSEPRFSSPSSSGRKNDVERSRNCSDLEIEEEYDVELVVPDGGWGWMVLFGSIIVNFLIPGMIKSFGVLFAEFLEVFDASPSAASWIPAISYCLYSSMGLFASALAARFSERKVTMVGGILASAGLMSSYFATSITYLYISYGLIGGLGAGLAYPIGIFIVGKYFDKKRGLANGLCTSGSALGSVLIPPLLRYLLNQYGYRGAILIMGAILLNVCIGALFYSPVEKHMKKVLIPRLKRASIIDHPQVGETKKNFSNNIEIRKIQSDSRFFGNREIAQSMPIAIPLPLQNMDNREIRDRRESDNIRRATFQIGHDTPQDSWVTPDDHKINAKSCEDTTSPLIARMIRENTVANDYSPKIPNRVTSNTNHPNNNMSLTNNTTGNEESECEPLVVDDVSGTIPTTNPFTSNSMDNKGQSGGGQSRQNLTAIPEDEDSESDSKHASSSFYNAHSLSAVNCNGQKPLRLSMSGGGIQMMFASANQSGLSRTLSVASNVSNSSFHYISTIHHGGVLSAMNLDKNLSEFTSTLNLRSQKRVDQPDENLEAERKPAPMKTMDLIRSIVDFSLFHDGMYIIMLLSNSMTAVGYTNFIILLPAYALTMGFDKEKATLLLSVVAAFDFLGRIGGGIFSDLRYFPRKWFYIIGLFFSGIVLAFIPLAKSYSTLVIFCACFGLASGIYIGVTAVILADFLGPEKLGSSYGITLFINGILQLIGPVVCGNLLSIISYEPILSGLGVILVIGSFFWIASPFVEQNRMRNISIATIEGGKHVETSYA